MISTTSDSKIISREEAERLFEYHINTAHITVNYSAQLFHSSDSYYDDYEDRTWHLLNDGFIRKTPKGSGTSYAYKDMIEDLIDILSNQKELHLWDNTKPSGNGTYTII